MLWLDLPARSDLPHVVQSGTWREAYATYTEHSKDGELQQKVTAAAYRAEGFSEGEGWRLELVVQPDDGVPVVPPGLDLIHEACRAMLPPGLIMAYLFDSNVQWPEPGEEADRWGRKGVHIGLVQMGRADAGHRVKLARDSS